MAQLYRQGVMSAGVAEVAAPPSGWTLKAVRAVLGTQPGDGVQLNASGGRVVFCRRCSPDLVGRFTANMRASFLTGHLIYGPALVISPSEPADWHNRD